MPAYIWLFIITVCLASALTLVVKHLAQRWDIVDDPKQDPGRKHQKKPIPLLGGLAIYAAFSVMLILMGPQITNGYLLPKHIIGICVAGAILMFGGTLDDKKNLSARWQIAFPIVAAIVIVISGIGINYITNPVGGIIYLDTVRLTAFTLNDLPYQIIIFADVFTVLWLLGTTYTTKLLDGLDGLVPGVTLIGGLVIFFLSISQEVAQPETGIVALLLAAAALGFLFWNFSPAKIYLGEGGALFTGFMLGVLAILSGGKIATALLILGLPIIDVAWVMIRRKWIEKKSPFSADTSHLHYQLRQFGWSDRKIVLLFYAMTLVFGLSTLWFTGAAKLVVLAVLIILSILLLISVFVRAKRLAK